MKITEGTGGQGGGMINLSVADRGYLIEEMRETYRVSKAALEEYRKNGSPADRKTIAAIWRRHYLRSRGVLKALGSSKPTKEIK